MNEAKLKACPFCGGDAESDMTQGFRRMMDGVISKAVAIYCLKCTAQITMCHDDHKEYAPEDMLTILTDAWNIRAGGSEPEANQNAGNIAGSVSANGSLAALSVKTQLTEMVAALDAGDSEKYWKNFEAVMSRHAELLDEVTRPENAEVRDRRPGASDLSATAIGGSLH